MASTGSGPPHATAPSQVIRIQNVDRAKDAVVTTVFQSEGLGHEGGANPGVTDDLAGSSVGTYYKNRLLIGGVFDKGILVCSPVFLTRSTE